MKKPGLTARSACKSRAALNPATRWGQSTRLFAANVVTLLRICEIGLHIAR